MLKSRSLLLLPQNPNPSPHLSFQSRCWVPSFLHRHRRSSSGLRSSMASSKIVVEYAKSSRSSCKKCSKSIPADSLRLGLVSRDPRVFDSTKWHHLDCFPRESQPIVSVEKIKGFDSLKNCDQEALKKLEEGGNLSPKEACDAGEAGIDGSEERSSKETKVHKTDEAVKDKLKDGNSKKPKLSASNNGAELEIVFSTSDVKNKYKDATLLPTWKAFQTIIFLERDEGLHDSGKIAAFDFDGCLVNTSVKRVGADAWSLMYPSVPEKLQSLYNDGYKLVIFTNESNIERWKNKRQQAVDSKIGRLNNFIKCVKVPIQVFIACGLGKTKGQGDDPFRKPKPGMWRIMEQNFNSGIAIDMDHKCCLIANYSQWDRNTGLIKVTFAHRSFYVGDAAGRVNDHSDADIKFAQAVGLKFHLPEEYFGA